MKPRHTAFSAACKTLPILLLTAVISSLPPLRAAEKDTSGTNPTVLLRSTGLSNEYMDLPSGNYLDTLTWKYTEPFNDGKMSLRLNVQQFWTDAGPDDSGFGDLSLKWTWVAKVTRTDGWIFNAELFAPTGDDFFSAHQWSLAPGITYARFLSKEVIIAPAYVHRFGFEADSGVPEIHAGAFDLYLVYRPQGKPWWLTADLTVGMNYDNTDMTPMSFELQCGRKLGTWGGAAVNGFVRPGVGFGDDRPYDWNIEASINIVGF